MNLRSSFPQAYLSSPPPPFPLSICLIPKHSQILAHDSEATLGLFFSHRFAASSDKTALVNILTPDPFPSNKQMKQTDLGRWDPHFC